MLLYLNNELDKPIGEVTFTEREMIFKLYEPLSNPPSQLTPIWAGEKLVAWSLNIAKR